MLSVIVIGGDHHNTLGVIRALGYKGIFSSVIIVGDTSKPVVGYSKYVGKKYVVSEKKEIVPILIHICKSLNQKVVIISCADFVTSELDLHQEELSPYCYLPIGLKQGALNHIMDKNVMANVAVKNGINVPLSWTFGKNETTTTSEVVYPCIAKPLVSIEGSKAEIAVFQDSKALDSYLRRGGDHRMMVQQYIDKNYEYQLIGCSINRGADIIIPGVSKCIRPCPATNTGFLEYIPISDFSCDLDACYRFIRDIGYSGLFSMEFLRDKNGKDYFMEINLRNDGNAICVTGAGVNLPYIWYLGCQGLDFTEEINKKVKNVFVMPEVNDFDSFVVPGKISLRQWIADYRKTSVFMEYDPTDPKPSKIMWFRYFMNYRNILSTLLRRRWHILKEHK